MLRYFKKSGIVRYGYVASGFPNTIFSWVEGLYPPLRWTVNNQRGGAGRVDKETTHGGNLA